MNEIIETKNLPINFDFSISMSFLEEYINDCKKSKDDINLSLSGDEIKINLKIVNDYER